MQKCNKKSTELVKGLIMRLEPSAGFKAQCVSWAVANDNKVCLK